MAKQHSPKYSRQYSEYVARIMCYDSAQQMEEGLQEIHYLAGIPKQTKLQVGQNIRLVRAPLPPNDSGVPAFRTVVVWNDGLLEGWLGEVGEKTAKLVGMGERRSSKAEEKKSKLPGMSGKWLIRERMWRLELKAERRGKECRSRMRRELWCVQEWRMEGSKLKYGMLRIDNMEVGEEVGKRRKREAVAVEDDMDDDEQAKKKILHIFQDLALERLRQELEIKVPTDADVDGEELGEMVTAEQEDAEALPRTSGFDTGVWAGRKAVEAGPGCWLI